ncbi:MAG: T9SS type A sorting domain-containing protein [Candidatus Cloacimonetes bacterium]|nr:T9SS type A sorting domain-containing protein [Candidatus Cloacimonadota bacterium]
MTHEYIIKVSADDDIYISWQEIYNDNFQRIRAQKISESGAVMWGESGLIISLPDEYISCNYYMDCDTDGNVCFMVSYRLDDWDLINISKFNPDGEIYPGWSAEGINVSNLGNGQYHGAMVASGENIFCVWAEERLDVWRDYYQIFIPTGEEILTENGEQLFEEERIYDNPVLSSTEDGKVLIFGYITGNETNSVRVRCIDSAGANAWVNDLIMDTDNSYDFKLEPSGDDDYFCSWHSHIETFGTWFSKFNTNGEMLWEPQYMVSNGDCRIVDIKADNSGGLWFCHSVYFPSDIWLQHINSEMEPVFESGGRLIYDQGRSGFYPQLMQCEATEALLSWYGTNSNEQRIYLQKVDNAGNLEFGEEAEYIYSQLGGSVEDFSIASCDEFTAIAWIDSRSCTVTGEIYLQIVDNATGEKHFAENGLLVGTQAGRNIVIALSEDNTRIGIGFRKFEDHGVYFQMTDIEGNTYFDSEGLLLIEDEVELLNDDLQIIAAGDGYNLAWSGHLLENEVSVYRQRVTEAGLQWGANGIVYQDFPDYSECITEALVQDYCLITNEEYNQANLYIVKFAEDGAVYPDWEMPGMNLSGAREFISYQDTKMINDQLLVIWSERIGMNERNIYGQLVNPDGSIEWENEGRLLLTDAAAVWRSSDLLIIDNNFLIATRQMDTFNIKIQKFNLEGEQLWEGNGIEPFESYSCGNHRLSYHNGVIAVYGAFSPDENNTNIYGAFYDLDGNLWEGIPELGFPICTKPNSQGGLHLSADSAGNDYLVWSDSRAEHFNEEDPSLYMQKIEVPVVAVGEDEIVSFVEINNYPNPFNGITQLVYQLPRSEAEAQIEIYNIKGQLIANIPAGLEGAEWNCCNMQGKKVSSGVYFYQLKGKNLQSQAHKMILLR